MTRYYTDKNQISCYDCGNYFEATGNIGDPVIITQCPNGCRGSWAFREDAVDAWLRTDDQRYFGTFDANGARVD